MQSERGYATTLPALAYQGHAAGTRVPWGAIFKKKQIARDDCRGTTAAVFLESNGGYSGASPVVNLEEKQIGKSRDNTGTYHMIS